MIRLTAGLVAMFFEVGKRQDNIINVRQVQIPWNHDESKSTI